MGGVGGMGARANGVSSSLSSVSVDKLEEESGKAQKVPYQHRTFTDFCMLVGRLFHDDSSVVLLDFLVREQRAYTESDIRERLKWKDNLLHQKLYALERQLLVQREQNFERGSKSPTYWRVSPHIVLTVDWHSEKLMATLQAQVDASQRLSAFECQSCHTKHSTLDAAAGLLSLEDEHPLCRHCGDKLGISNSEEAKSDLRDKQDRASRQLAPLRTALHRVRNMTVPVFTPFTRADKNEQKREQSEEQSQETPATDTGGTNAGGSVTGGSVTGSSVTGNTPKKSDIVVSGMPTRVVDTNNTLMENKPVLLNSGVTTGMHTGVSSLSGKRSYESAMPGAGSDVSATGGDAKRMKLTVTNTASGLSQGLLPNIRPVQQASLAGLSGRAASQTTSSRVIPWFQPNNNNNNMNNINVRPLPRLQPR